MLIEGTLLALAVLVWKKMGKEEKWDAEREAMYQSALEHLKGPSGVERLYAIAAECEKQGFHSKAYALRARAKLRDTDAATKKVRHEAFLKGMRSTNVEGILKLAKTFEAISATGAADRLRKRAANLEAGINDDMDNTPPAAPPAAAAPPAPEGVKTGVEAKPTIPDEAPQAEPAAVEEQIPPPVVVRRRAAKAPVVEGFDSIEAAKAAINGSNGKHTVETVTTQEGSDEASP